MPDPALVARLRAAGCVFAEDEARLLIEAAATPAALDDLVARRVGGAPLEALLGFAGFRGLRIVVEPGVFVPRRRTAFLVEQALPFARPGTVAVDLCCGTGAIGAALVAAVPGLVVHAADVSPTAVVCAGRNLPPTCVHVGDLYEALPSDLRGQVELLVVNAPYVPSEAIATMPPEARLHEPRFALDGGIDGLDVQRRVVAGASAWLAPAGVLLIETSQGQAPATAALFEAAGMTTRVARSDEADATVVVGRAG